MGRMPLGAMHGQGGCGTRLEVERQSQALGWRRAGGGCPEVERRAGGAEPCGLCVFAGRRLRVFRQVLYFRTLKLTSQSKNGLANGRGS